MMNYYLASGLRQKIPYNPESNKEIPVICVLYIGSLSVVLDF